MNTANHISPEDLALFALQFLPDDELQVALDHMEHCEACRMEVAQLQGDMVGYAMASEMHSPPALARERLMRRVAKEKKAIPIDRDHPQAEPMLSSRNSILFPMDTTEEPAPRHGVGFMGWAGWAVAAGIALMAGAQYHQKQMLQSTLAAEAARNDQSNSDAQRAQQAMQTLTDAGALQVALTIPPPKSAAPPPPPKPEGYAAYLADKGQLVFVANHLEALPEYKTYELWVLPTAESGRPAVPAGIFKPDANGNASVVLPDLPKGITASGFGVTVEDDGGSKTPTMPIRLVGTI